MSDGHYLSDDYDVVAVGPCLAQQLPQPEGEHCDWTYFVYKAAKGSYKASEALYEAELVLLDRLLGPHREATGAEEDLAIKGIVGPCPFVNHQEILEQFRMVKDPGGRLLAELRPRNRHECYESLWSRKRTVRQDHLLHDASLSALEHWTPDQFHALMTQTAGHDAYNSVDCVAAMLILAVSLSERNRPPGPGT